MDPRKAAEFYMKKGFWPVPGKPGSKEPAIKRPVEADDVGRFLNAFDTNSNVALMLGQPSGGLVDGDIDCPLAASAAQLFLPPTGMKSGRPGARLTHWFWLSPVGQKVEFVDPVAGKSRSMILELRASKCLTMVPPSRHPTGELLAWDTLGPPSQVEQVVLLRSGTFLATSALMARHWPSAGSRHQAALALAGFLLQVGVEEDDARRCLQGVALMTQDTEAVDRVKTVATTAARIRASKPVVGETRLGELLPPEAVAVARTWLDRALRFNVRTPSDASDASRGHISPVDSVLKLVREELGAVCFRSPSRSAGFVAVRSGDGERTYDVKSRDFRLFLGRAFRSKFGRTCTSKSIEEALECIEGDCLYGSEEIEVHSRVARVGDRIYLHMGDERNRVIRVERDGWKILKKCGAKFVRSNTSLPMLEPTRGGDLAGIWRVVNITDRLEQLLVLTWTTMAIGRPDVPCPILFLHGEQGSAKSTTTFYMQCIVDPTSAPLRSPPPDRHALAIAAAQRRLLTFDNWSSIKQDMSDAFCQLVTGGAFAVRRFYHDSEETTFTARRAMIVNGIPDLARFPDLMGRALTISLPRLTQRLQEDDLKKAFLAIGPAVLGRILDAVATGLRCLPEVNMDGVELDRMADFCAWGCAVAPEFGYTQEEFLEALRRNRVDSESATIDGSAIIRPLKVAVLKSSREFVGTASQLHELMCEWASENQRKHPEWPKSADALGKQLRREAPAIRRAGMEIDLGLRSSEKSGKRLVRIVMPKKGSKVGSPPKCQKRTSVGKPRMIESPKRCAVG